MAGYVQLDGVRTWYEEHGAAQALVLLHPGGPGSTCAPSTRTLARCQHASVSTRPERRGHGRTPDVEGPITFDAMAQDTIAFLEAVVGGSAHLVACGDGAAVALLVAPRRPDLIRHMVLVAGAFHHDGWVPETIDPDNQPPEFLARLYADVSPDVRRTTGDRRQARPDHIQEPTLAASDQNTSRAGPVMVGDDEVTLEHAVEMYLGLPDAELMVVPGTRHGLLSRSPSCATPLSSNSSPPIRRDDGADPQSNRLNVGNASSAARLPVGEPDHAELSKATPRFR